MIGRNACIGCQDDIYNHQDFGLNRTTDGFRCWSAAAATMALARDVPVDLPPPYLALPLVERPSCYKASRVVRVPAAALDGRGYWK